MATIFGKKKREEFAEMFNRCETAADVVDLHERISLGGIRVKSLIGKQAEMFLRELGDHERVFVTSHTLTRTVAGIPSTINWFETTKYMDVITDHVLLDSHYVVPYDIYSLHFDSMKV